MANRDRERGPVDYYQSVVIEYLRADRAVFVNTEYCIQIEPGKNPDVSGPHWYCDAVAIDFGTQPTPTVFLCEVSYAEKLQALTNRLKHWSAHWEDLRQALARDSHIRQDWPVRPWLFVPQKLIPLAKEKLIGILTSDASSAFHPRITHLEAVQPWNYSSWQHRDGDTVKPTEIPEEWRS